MKHEDFFKNNKTRWAATGILLVLLIATVAYQNTVYQNVTDTTPPIEEEENQLTEAIASQIPEQTDPTQEGKAEDSIANSEDLAQNDIDSLTEPAKTTSDEQITWILPLSGEIGRLYGYSYDPTFEDYRFHHGIDIMAEPGTPIYAAADGEVILARDDAGWGGVLTIDHGNGWQSIYRCIETELQHGANPKAGEIIGYIIENAPSESGQEAHLHFELTQNDENVDPEKWL